MPAACAVWGQAKWRVPGTLKYYITPKSPNHEMEESFSIPNDSHKGNTIILIIFMLWQPI